MSRTLSIASTVLVLLTLSACTPYPRYKPYSPTTPQIEPLTDQLLNSNSYIRFGLILQKYLGKPYKGTSKYVPGLDCSAFTQRVFREFNKTELPRKAAAQHNVGKTVPRHRVSFGDLVFFETERNRISHVGIYIGYNEFIHASSSRGVIISGMNEEYWSRRYVGARRILE